MFSLNNTDKCGKNLSDAESPDNSRTLGIIHEFRQLYEEKMRILDAEGSGDCSLQAKLSLQQDWIRDLNEQNEMLVRAVEELEQEATERVIALEDKLRQSSKCACEVMNGYKDLSNAFQHVDALQEDVVTLIEFIRRSACRQTWDTSGLELRTVQMDAFMDDINNHYQNNNNKLRTDKMQEQLAQKDEDIKILKEKLECAIKCKEMLAAEMEKDKADEIRQSMMDMRDALTAEVADKHDAIITLKRDVQILEEQCRKADQQTHFKDDIIKELRKQIKQMKLERCGSTCVSSGVASVHTVTQNIQTAKNVTSEGLILKLRNACDNTERKFHCTMIPSFPTSGCSIYSPCPYPCFTKPSNLPFSVNTYNDGQQTIDNRQSSIVQTTGGSTRNMPVQSNGDQNEDTMTNTNFGSICACATKTLFNDVGNSSKKGRESIIFDEIITDQQDNRKKSRGRSMFNDNNRRRFEYGTNQKNRSIDYDVFENVKQTSTPWVVKFDHDNDGCSCMGNTESCHSYLHENTRNNVEAYRPDSNHREKYLGTFATCKRSLCMSEMHATNSIVKSCWKSPREQFQNICKYNSNKCCNTEETLSPRSDAHRNATKSTSCADKYNSVRKSDKSCYVCNDELPARDNNKSKSNLEETKKVYATTSSAAKGKTDKQTTDMNKSNSCHSNLNNQKNIVCPRGQNTDRADKSCNSMAQPQKNEKNSIATITDFKGCHKNEVELGYCDYMLNVTKNITSPSQGNKCIPVKNHEVENKKSVGVNNQMEPPSKPKKMEICTHIYDNRTTCPEMNKAIESCYSRPIESCHNRTDKIPPHSSTPNPKAFEDEDQQRYQPQPQDVRGNLVIAPPVEEKVHSCRCHNQQEPALSATLPRPKIRHKKKRLYDEEQILKLSRIMPDVKPTPKQTPAIYKDERFHKMVQTGQNPIAYDVSMINLRKMIGERAQPYIVTKLAKKQDNCDCRIPGRKPITKRNLERMTRKADYLEVKAALNVSDSSDSQTVVRQFKRKKCDCSDSRECLDCYGNIRCGGTCATKMAKMKDNSSNQSHCSRHDRRRFGKPCCKNPQKEENLLSDFEDLEETTDRQDNFRKLRQSIIENIAKGSLSGTSTESSRESSYSSSDSSSASSVSVLMKKKANDKKNDDDEDSKSEDSLDTIYEVYNFENNINPFQCHSMNSLRNSCKKHLHQNIYNLEEYYMSNNYKSKNNTSSRKQQNKSKSKSKPKKTTRNSNKIAKMPNFSCSKTQQLEIPPKWEAFNEENRNHRHEFQSAISSIPCDFNIASSLQQMKPEELQLLMRNCVNTDYIRLLVDLVSKTDLHRPLQHETDVLEQTLSDNYRTPYASSSTSTLINNTRTEEEVRREITNRINWLEFAKMFPNNQIS